MEWKEVRLGDIADVQTGPFGSQLHKSDYIAEGIPCIMPTNIGPHLNLVVDGIAHVSEADANRLSRHLTEFGDIIYARRGDIEKCAYVTTNEEKWLCGTGCLKIRCKNEVNSRFIAYLLSTAECKKWITGNAVGTTMLNLSKGILSNLPLIIPSLADQRRIASILSSLDRKIELNNKINADLEEMAQAIFKNWFVDFEPFKDGKFVNSELGMIPEGWKVGTLKDLLYLRKDSIKSTNRGKLPYLPIDTIPMHNLVATDFKSNEEAKSSLQIFEENDIIVGAMRVYFHRVILAPCRGITRTTCFVLSVKDENNLAYSLMQCNQDEAISFAERTSKGSTMPYAVWDGGYGEYKIVIPPCDVMKSFNDLLCNFLSKMNENAIENRTLSLLRDTLLPRLMSGEIEVPE